MGRCRTPGLSGEAVLGDSLGKQRDPPRVLHPSRKPGRTGSEPLSRKPTKPPRWTGIQMLHYHSGAYPGGFKEPALSCPYTEGVLTPPASFITQRCEKPSVRRREILDLPARPGLSPAKSHRAPRRGVFECLWGCSLCSSVRLQGSSGASSCIARGSLVSVFM